MSNGSDLRPFFPTVPRSREDKAGPVLNEPRAILNGILWVLRTGAPWKDLPERYPPYQTCHRGFQRWRKEGGFDAVLLALAGDLRERGKLDLREAFIDETFAPAKKGAVPLVEPGAARAPRMGKLQHLALGDLSRVDAMIALRLRATGRPQPATPCRTHGSLCLWRSRGRGSGEERAVSGVLAED